MRLEIICQDRLGITQDVLDILVNYEIDLRGIEIDITGKIFLNFPTIEFKDFQHLMPEIRRIEGIEDVKTTPFMPIEREQNQLRALLQTLPDPVFSIDTRGRILLVNEAVLSSLELANHEILGTEIGEYVKGFNFHKWLESRQVLAQTQKLKFIEQDFLADILPVSVPDVDDNSILAGALIMLKSEFRLGQQLTVFHKASSDSFASIQANSNVMKKLVKDATRMAELDGPVLFFGESGTGKQTLARACHEASRRSQAEFIALNCGALPEALMELELFGCEPGNALAVQGKEGILNKAQGGTLFLSDVADLSPLMQEKLLGVLERGQYRTVGGEQELSLDVRFICATQKDLGQQVSDGLFREDLYFRLNVLSLVVPPLRDRKSDIMGLAERFLRQHSIKLGRRPPKLSKSSVDYLQSYPWPGNVRQLENALYRALSLLEGNELGKEQLQLPSATTSGSFFAQEFEGTLEDEVKRFEKSLLKRLYPSYPSTRQLAKKLGLSHTAIANKLREYGINKKSVKL